jgi:hypothetical protein
MAKSSTLKRLQRKLSTAASRIIKPQTIYRKRLVKDRPLEITNGSCYLGFHYKKRSLYVLKPFARQNSVKTLQDNTPVENHELLETTYNTFSVNRHPAMIYDAKGLHPIKSIRSYEQAFAS